MWVFSLLPQATEWVSVSWFEKNECHFSSWCGLGCDESMHIQDRLLEWLGVITTWMRILEVVRQIAESVWLQSAFEVMALKWVRTLDRSLRAQVETWEHLLSVNHLLFVLRLHWVASPPNRILWVYYWRSLNMQEDFFFLKFNRKVLSCKQ